VPDPTLDKEARAEDRRARPEPTLDKRARAEPLSSKIADALREDILFGRRRQGDPVTQQGVAEEFGVSTMPVREALIQLAHEGMITARTNHTFRVARMTRSDVNDIYWMHGLLAGELAERACRKATPELLDTLYSIHNDFVIAFNSGDLDAVERHNWNFHRVVNRAADAPKLLSTLRSVVLQIPKHLYVMLEGAGETSIRDHPLLIEAFRSGNCSGVRDMWSAHVQAAGEFMTQYLTSQGYWS
jgi:DNA-binding GntR family transcriptional regulator